MALRKKVYGVKQPFSARNFAVHGVFNHHPQSRKPVAPQSEIRHFGRLQLKLQFVSDQGDELGIQRIIPQNGCRGDLLSPACPEVAEDYGRTQFAPTR